MSVLVSGLLAASLSTADDTVTAPDAESLEETIEILAGADAMRRLHASDIQIAEVGFRAQEELDAAMRRRHATS